jgi:microcystin degradation protein MlrC
MFLSQGIDPLSRRVLVVKSSHHFRSDFDSIAGRIVLVDSGGPVSPDLKSLQYRRLRRPIWPLDAETDPWILSVG